MGLLSLEGLCVQVLSVLFNVGLQLSQLVSESLSLGDQYVVNQVIPIEQISVGILDFLLQSSGVSVVVVSSS